MSKAHSSSVRSLVTGGAGFIGSHLVDELISSGRQVTVLDDFSTGHRSNLSHHGSMVNLVEGSVADEATCRLAVTGADEIFHLASRVSVVESVEDPDLYRDVVLEGTKRILRAAEEGDARRVVLASSCSVYGPASPPVSEHTPLAPESPYAEFKMLAEEACRDSRLSTVCPRFFNVYGARQRSDSPYSGVIAIFADLARRSVRPKIFGDGLQTRDFIHVTDIVKGLRLCMSSGAIGKGEAINLGTGRATTVLDLARLLGCEPPTFQPARSGEIRHSMADISRARDTLDFDPTMVLEEGLKDVQPNGADS